MAKKFGRNQKRKMREQIAAAERAHEWTRELWARTDAERRDLERRLAKAIEIDVAVFRRDPRGEYEARLKAHKMGEQGLYQAMFLDERRLCMDKERDRFIEHVARAMATEMFRSIGGRW